MCVFFFVSQELFFVIFVFGVNFEGCFLGNGVSICSRYAQHRWDLRGNYPVLAMEMVIYHYVERIWIILVTPIFCITYTIMNKQYSVEPVNIHIRSLINIILENNWLITTKKGKGKLPIFCGNGEQVITIYDAQLILSDARRSDMIWFIIIGGSGTL